MQDPANPNTDETILDASGNRVVLPKMTDYHELGMQWGLPRAEEILSTIPKNNRVSSTGIFEAQALQSNYDLDKTMLCIVLKVSRNVLDEAL